MNFEIVKKKAASWDIEGYRKSDTKDNIISVGIKNDDISIYLGPLVSYKKHGKGIRYFKENICFIEGEFRNDHVFGKANFFRKKKPMIKI